MQLNLSEGFYILKVVIPFKQQLKLRRRRERLKNYHFISSLKYYKNIYQHKNARAVNGLTKAAAAYNGSKLIGIRSYFFAMQY